MQKKLSKLICYPCNRKMPENFNSKYRQVISSPTQNNHNFYFTLESVIIDIAGFILNYLFYVIYSEPCCLCWLKGFTDGLQRVCDNMNDSSQPSAVFESLCKTQQKEFEKMVKSNTSQQTKQILKENQVSQLKTNHLLVDNVSTC